MKVLSLIARILLGLTFVVFGLNGFLHFIPQPPTPEVAQTFFAAMAATGYMIPLLFATQIAGGILLLVGLVPLGVLVLTPVIINIFGFHLFVVPDGLPVAIVVAALAAFLAWVHRGAYAALFRPAT
jgi:hypothetical protein